MADLWLISPRDSLQFKRLSSRFTADYIMGSYGPHTDRIVVRQRQLARYTTTRRYQISCVRLDGVHVRIEHFKTNDVGARFVTRAPDFDREGIRFATMGGLGTVNRHAFNGIGKPGKDDGAPPAGRFESRNVGLTEIVAAQNVVNVTALGQLQRQFRILLMPGTQRL